MAAQEAFGTLFIQAITLPQWGTQTTTPADIWSLLKLPHSHK